MPTAWARLRKVMARMDRVRGHSAQQVNRCTVQQTTAKVVQQHRGPKGVAFKFKRRKGFHKTIGFRRHLTQLKAHRKTTA